MHRSGPHAIVLARNGRWARLRVRGLLRNAALAERLTEAASHPISVRLETGSVQVPLMPGRSEAYWIEWASAQVESHDPARGRRDTATAVQVVVRATTSDGQAHPRVTSAATAAEPDAAPHSLPTAQLLANAGDEGPLDPAFGLSSTAAAARLARDGPNEIRDITGRSATQILLSQFSSVPVGLLGGSAGLALATRAFADAGAIGTVLAANATLGFLTERRAEQTVSSLRQLGPRQATVLRDGEVRTLDARHVVVGDVLLLRPGEPVAADARVVEAHRLATNEAALTGESLPVRKEAVDALPAATPLGERRNMVFLGTVV